jgi:hypothetical protein
MTSWRSVGFALQKCFDQDRYVAFIADYPDKEAGRAYLLEAVCFALALSGRLTWNEINAARIRLDPRIPQNIIETRTATFLNFGIGPEMTEFAITFSAYHRGLFLDKSTRH